MLKYFDEGAKGACALLLGGFDGFHRGHGSLLSAAKKTALPVGLTALSGGKGGELFPLPEREDIFRALGFAFADEHILDGEFRETPAEDFLRDLFSRIPAKAVFCGEDFRFGKDAAGTPALLKERAPCPVTVLPLAALGGEPCPVTVLPLAALGGEKIAVTRIKQLLSEGEMEKVNALLCTPYFVRGVAEHGRAVGRTYGFPTANLRLPSGKFPLKEGVYAARARLERGEEYPAIVNFGPCPTFGVEARKTEAHLVGFQGDLYGEEVTLFPVRLLRPVRKFQSKEALEKQLGADRAAALGLVGAKEEK